MEERFSSVTSLEIRLMDGLPDFAFDDDDFDSANGMWVAEEGMNTVALAPMGTKEFKRKKEKSLSIAIVVKDDRRPSDDNPLMDDTCTDDAHSIAETDEETVSTDGQSIERSQMRASGGSLSPDTMSVNSAMSGTSGLSQMSSLTVETYSSDISSSSNQAASDDESSQSGSTLHPPKPNTKSVKKKPAPTPPSKKPSIMSSEFFFCLVIVQIYPL